MKASEGLVFDIERFAVHDGKGIRTTVFLKGCPLRCRWCHNPEGLEQKRRPIFRKEKCLHCHHCEQTFDAITWDLHKDRPVFDPNATDFDKAVYDCPSGAIDYDSKRIGPKDLVREIEKDRPFFREDGGVTFSGGEPFMQPDFLLEVLRLCREKGIRTAVETSLKAPLEIVQKAAPLLDQIFFDIKFFQPEGHQKLTGVNNASILGNARWLLSSEHASKITVRTPLIPGCTETDENIQEIAGFLAELDPDVQYELLNYNPLASSKYELAEKDFLLSSDLKRLTAEKMDHYRFLARSKGLKNILER